MAQGNSKRTAKHDLISIVLMHTDVLMRDGSPGCTSVTNLDVHDLARLSRTFGLHACFMVTPVTSQQRHTARIIDHWTSGHGAAYNPDRMEAIRTVRISHSLDSVSENLAADYGRSPVMIGTAARNIANKVIDYGDVCDRMLSADRPVALVFGTGWGLHENAVRMCDAFLKPIDGIDDYNHLSVRSAVAITIDRLISTMQGVRHGYDSRV